MRLPAMGLTRTSSASLPVDDRRKLRVLCLHGFRTSGLIMETQLNKLHSSVHDLLDKVCPDASFPALGKSAVEGIFDPPYYEWFQFEKNDDEVKYKNLDECIQFITELMKKHGPFDGLLGFSQGAFLSAALAGMQEQGLALTSVPALRFVIILSGGILKGEHKVMRCFSKPIKCPSLHLIGDKDFLKTSNEELVLAFENPVILRHGATHTIPRLDKEATMPIKTFLQKFMCNTQD